MSFTGPCPPEYLCMLGHQCFTKKLYHRHDDVWLFVTCVSPVANKVWKLLEAYIIKHVALNNKPQYVVCSV